MPGWNVHLEAGNRIADKLKLAPEKRREFILGCVLPDINNGYINNPRIQKTHEETHCTHSENPIQNFLEENKEEIRNHNAIFLGYLFHLYTDYTFNHDYENRIKDHLIGEKSKAEQEDIKHNDFWIYGTNYYNTLDITSEDAATLTEKANQITQVEIDAEDIAEVEKIIRLNTLNDGIKDNDYILYTKKDLDELLDYVCDSFTKDYL